MYCIILFKTFIFDLIEHDKRKKYEITLYCSFPDGSRWYNELRTMRQKSQSYIFKNRAFDAAGALKHAEDEKTVVEFDKSDITVSITKDDGDQKMTGKVKSNICTWKVPYKEGKTMLSITLTNDNGEARDFAVTIEGKDGKIALWAESKEEPDDKIKLDVDKFEEKNQDCGLF